jgi:nitrate reductase gamma subunit
MSDHALFAVAPFVSVVILVVAATVRALHHNPVSARPSLAVARRLATRHPLAAIGLLGVLLGHVVMIAWPDQLLTWNRNVSRLIAFELALFALGAAALVGIAAAIRRHVLRRTADGGSVADAAFLAAVLLTFVSGLGIALVYRWAAVWSAVTVTHYARSLLSLQPRVEPLEAMPYLVKLHIFSSFIVIALLAFTRLVDVLLTVLVRAVTVVMSPFVSIVERQRRLLQDWALRSGRSLLWPEEEED